MTQVDGANEPIVLLDDGGNGIVTLTLNRPDKRNALSSAMIAKLKSLLDGIADDRSIKAVILAAAGPAFSSGHDLNEVRGLPTQAAQQDLFLACSRMMTTIVRLPQPVIAKVQGIATAAGCQLVASCDLAVASDEARFGTPGVNIGLFCSTPAVAIARAVATKHTMEMLLTGEAIDAQTAYRFGLVNKVVPPSALDGAAMDYALKIASKSTETIAMGKAAFYKQVELDLDNAYAFTSEIMARNMMGRDAKEGIEAFLQKRRPEWRGR